MAAVHFMPATTMDSMQGYPAHDMDAFSVFHPADPNLLTPVSNAGSPSIGQKPQRSTPATYEHGVQGPTPPNSSKLFYTHEMGIPSSSPSPMPMTVNPFDMTPNMVHSSPYHSAHPSPSMMNSEIPPPMDPYLGSYGVSGGDEFGEYFPPVTAAMQHTSGPLLTQAFRPAPRVGMVEDLRDPNWAMHGGFPPNMSPGRRVAPRRKVTTPRKAAPRGTPKQGSVARIEGSNGILGSMTPEDDGEKEELTLRDDAPEDEKFLFQLRKDFIAEKGKGMWDDMKAKYSEKHKGVHEKAALQMKVSRAVAKYGVWPQKELERLEEAYRYIEERRYNLILGRMKELGGCKCWDWKPQHIETQLVKLGFEEATPDEKTGVRRRKNKLARRRAGTTGAIGMNQAPQMHHAGLVHPGMHHQMPVHPMTHITSHNGAIMNNWVDGLGVLPPHMIVHQAPPLSRTASYESAPGGLAMPMPMPMPMTATSSPEPQHTPALEMPSFTNEEEDSILDSVFKPSVKLEASLSPAAEDDGMDMIFDDSVDLDQDQGDDMHNQQSERVARQACEQMMGRIAEPQMLAAR